MNICVIDWLYEDDPYDHYHDKSSSKRDDRVRFRVITYLRSKIPNPATDRLPKVDQKSIQSKWRSPQEKIKPEKTQSETKVRKRENWKENWKGERRIFIWKMTSPRDLQIRRISQKLKSKFGNESEVNSAM
ncbi:20498_t:CDS:2 [Gigaspora rosea]|nr:20498_t:CDS:2 [Gigaspora rosea]